MGDPSFYQTYELLFICNYNSFPILVKREMFFFCRGEPDVLRPVQRQLPSGGELCYRNVTSKSRKFFHAAGNFDGDFAETGIFCVNMMEFL